MTPAEKIDRVRNWLAFFLVGAFVAALCLLIFWGMPVTSKDIVTYMVGQLSGMASTALVFYFSKGAGQDQADAAKTENTGKMAEAITATARAAVPVVDKPTGKPGDPVHTMEEGQ